MREKKTKEIAYNGKCIYCNHINTDITIMNCPLCFTSLKPKIFDYLIRNDLNQYLLEFDVDTDGFFDYKMDIRKCLRIFNKLNKNNNENDYINNSILSEIIIISIFGFILLFITISINLLPLILK